MKTKPDIKAVIMVNSKTLQKPRLTSSRLYLYESSSGSKALLHVAGRLEVEECEGLDAESRASISGMLLVAVPQWYTDAVVFI